jgi:hypothetical protein
LVRRHHSRLDGGTVRGDLRPKVVELGGGQRGQRLVECDEQLLGERVGQAVDAVVVESTRQVLRGYHVVIGVVVVDDEDHLVRDCDGGA